MSDEPNQQSISDDQELAKVLAGVGKHPADSTVHEEIITTPVPDPAPVPTPDEAAAEDLAAGTAPLTDEQQPSQLPDQILPEPRLTPPSAGTTLDGIKLEALKELRPLVDKLNVSNEEKFDTYLLLLRSTDDQDLISPAHEAAKSIEDETRRAQALLDIIKEIDFLSQNKAA